MRQSVLVLTGSPLRLESTLVGNLKANLLLPTIGNGGQRKSKITLSVLNTVALYPKKYTRVRT